MEPYMQAYPPYWYYLARTEQELGELVAAAQTYASLAQIGDGHFRKDDMLATSLANLAVIQDHLGSRECVATAARALDYSPDVWEANLLCARVLEKHGRTAQAEDAILRNLDIALETEQSLVFLASLYFHSNDGPKLVRLLSNPQVVAALPAPVLLRCAACVGIEKTPPQVMETVLASLDVQQRPPFAGDELQVRLSPAWQLHLARVEVAYRGQRLSPSPVERVADAWQLRYSLAGVGGSGGDAPVSLRFVYPDETRIEVALQSDAPASAAPSLGFLPLRTSASRSAALKVSSVSINETRIAVGTNSAERPYVLPVDVTVE
jgi:hypothetical protein